ncbi:MAG: hypothetical protein ACRD3W_17975 [Terriglobales bacterium]
METAQILNSNEAPKATTRETASAAAEKKAQNEAGNGNERCKNGVCMVTWKPQRPAAA